jgi:DNA mismatch endonuclease (patch repair protein)
LADVFTPAKRSEVMSRIRGRGNKGTEQALVSLLRAHKITGWRRNQPIFGKPDFVFPKLRVAVFVDGCFWHSCPLHGTRPKNNSAFWHNKLAKNKARDLLVSRTLRKNGWRVLRIWEHELSAKKQNRWLKRLQQFVRAAGHSSPASRLVKDTSKKAPESGAGPTHYHIFRRAL